jgi:hypothetical protein
MEYDAKCCQFPLVFNNMVDSDGYKSFVHYVYPDTYLARRTDKDKVVIQESTENNFQWWHKMTNEECTEVMGGKKMLIVDPGKTNIVMIGDGVKSGKHFRYTAKQRREESEQNHAHKKRTKLLRRTHLESGIGSHSTLARHSPPSPWMNVGRQASVQQRSMDPNVAVLCITE